MVKKTPNLDSFVVVKDDIVTLEVEYSANGPAGAQVLVNGETDLTTSLHPSKSKFTIDFPCEEVGQYEIQIMIEGAAPGELKKLKEGSTEPVKEMTLIDTTWSITVADPNELYQSDTERVVEHVKNLLALYTAGNIGVKAIERLREYSSELPEEAQEELTTLSDFTEDNEE